MHAMNLLRKDLSDDISAQSANDAFADTVVLAEQDNGVTTRTLTLSSDMDATAVMPSAMLLRVENGHCNAVNDAMAVPVHSIDEMIAMLRENSLVMRLMLERIATAALAGEHYPFEDYRWQLQCLADASDSLGLQGLQRFFAHLAEATQQLESASFMSVMQASKVLDRWPVLVVDYLHHCGESAQSQMLVQYVSSTEFFMPMTADNAGALLRNLTSAK